MQNALYHSFVCDWTIQKQITQKKENNGESLRNHDVSAVQHYCYCTKTRLHTISTPWRKSVAGITKLPKSNARAFFNQLSQKG